MFQNYFTQTGGVFPPRGQPASEAQALWAAAFPAKPVPAARRQGGRPRPGSPGGRTDAGSKEGGPAEKAAVAELRPRSAAGAGESGRYKRKGGKEVGFCCLAVNVFLAHQTLIEEVL